MASGSQEIERCDLATATPMLAAEHLHRYAMAAQAAKGLRVLDLAAGTGYGTRLLHRAGAEVIPLDLDLTALRQCGSRAVAARAEALPFANESFELVTCFELLEHVARPTEILDEIARILTRDGLALLSTPDRRLYSGRWGLRNPHHLHEMTYDEFRQELGARFTHITLYGQSVWSGSWAAELDEGGTPARAGLRNLRVLKAPLDSAETAWAAPWADAEDAVPPTPLFLLAACTPDEAASRRLRRLLGRESVFHDPLQRILGHGLATEASLVSRDLEIESQQQHARQLQVDRCALVQHAENLVRQRDELAQHAENFDELLSTYRKRVVELESQMTNLERACEERALHGGNVESLLGEANQRVAELEIHARNLERACEERALHGGNVESLLAVANQRVADLENHAGNLEMACSEQVRHAENLETLLQEARERVEDLERHTANLEGLREDQERREHEQARLLQEERRRAAMLAYQHQGLLQDLEAIRTALDRMNDARSVRILRRLHLID